MGSIAPTCHLLPSLYKICEVSGYMPPHVQALYYWLRTYLLERRDIASKTELVVRGTAHRAQAQMAAAAAANSANSSDVVPTTSNNSSDATPGNSMAVVNQVLLPAFVSWHLY